jgi:lysophospholipase L1-like esterase
VAAACSCAPQGCRSNDAPAAIPIAAAAPSLVAAPSEVEVEVPMVAMPGGAALRARTRAQRSALGDEAPLFEDEAGRAVPWIATGPIATGSLVDPLDDALLDGLPGSSGLGGNQPTDGPSMNGNALGLFEPIEGEGQPLAHFHRALRALEAGRDDDGKVRVLVFGASHTEADIYPQYVRSYLQERYGDGGHGFVMPAQPWRGYSHLEIGVSGLDHWRTEHAQRREGRDDGRYGLLGASISASNRRAVGRLVHAPGVVASRYELYYLGQPRGGTLELVADGRRVAEVDTAAREVGPGYYAFELPEAEHTIEVRVRGDGEVRLLGLTVERDDPGVVVDTLGIRGTRAANALEWDLEVWSDNVRRRAPDLVILAFGTNEATDVEQPMTDYEARLTAVLQRYREATAPASCLLIGPGDFPQPAEGGAVVPRARVGEIIDAQQRVAAAHGCGFWDLQAFMGGELSMVQWVRSTPPMAAPDFIHLSRRGYVRMGMALVDALMMDLDGGDPLRAR